jgi:hypothetical protein
MRAHLLGLLLASLSLVGCGDKDPNTGSDTDADADSDTDADADADADADVDADVDLERMSFQDIEFVLIPAGAFRMGQVASKTWRIPHRHGAPRSGPRHHRGSADPLQPLQTDRVLTSAA